MDEKLAQTKITLPPAEQMRRGFEGIERGEDNLKMWEIIFTPLLGLADTPLAIGALIFMLSQMFEKYEHYLSKVNMPAALNFRLFNEFLVDEILSVLIPELALRQTVITEFIGNHDCEGKLGWTVQT